MFLQVVRRGPQIGLCFLLIFCQIYCFLSQYRA